MSTHDYSRNVATANKLIAKYGRSLTVERRANGVLVKATESDAVILDYTNDQIDGTRILRTDRQVFISVERLAFEPLPNDRLVVDGKSLIIVTIKPLNPAGVVVFYELQVRA